MAARVSPSLSAQGLLEHGEVLLLGISDLIGLWLRQSGLSQKFSTDCHVQPVLSTCPVDTAQGWRGAGLPWPCGVLAAGVRPHALPRPPAVARTVPAPPPGQSLGQGQQLAHAGKCSAALPGSGLSLDSSVEGASGPSACLQTSIVSACRGR